MAASIVQGENPEAAGPGPRRLKAVAEQGTDYLYKGPVGRRSWSMPVQGGRRLHDHRGPGRPTIVIWSAPLVAKIGDHELHVSPPRRITVCVAAIEGASCWAPRLGALAGEPALDEIRRLAAPRARADSRQMVFSRLPARSHAEGHLSRGPGPVAGQSRPTGRANAQALWAQMAAGRACPSSSSDPKHSERRFVGDRQARAISRRSTHSSNHGALGQGPV